MSKTILAVIGGTGNIGLGVLQELNKNDSSFDSIRVLTRNNKADDMVFDNPKIVKVFGSPLDRTSLRTLLLPEGGVVKRVFVCLAQAYTQEEMSVCGTNILSVLSEASELPERIVKISSYGIDNKSKTFTHSQGPLGEAHCTFEASALEKHIQVYSIRPTSFFTNFTKYDLPSIVEGNSFSSAVATSEVGNSENDTAKVNWVSLVDIAQVAAAALYGCEAIETIYTEQKQYSTEPASTVILDVTGGDDNTLSPADVAAACTEILTRMKNKDHNDERDKDKRDILVTCSAAPLPSGFPGADAYADLFTFLRHGGFNASTSVVERVLGRPPEKFVDFLSQRLS